MSKDIRIKKGLDIKLVGEAKENTTKIPFGGIYALKPEDFHGITPKLVAKEGTEVKAGETIFYSKDDERILFPSPVSGFVTQVIRGERRKILEIIITASASQNYKDFGVKEVSKMTSEEVKNHLLASGCWPFIKQRPYDIVAMPNQAPKAIFISGYDTAPLAADYDYVLKGKEAELQTALNAVGKLTEGKVHVSVSKKATNSPFLNLKGIELHKVEGPHPIGNVSTQIAKLNPINKGEVIWTVTPQDLVVIGELLLTGKLNLERTIALTGSQIKEAHYVTAVAGATMKSILGDLNNDKIRVISGNALTGKEVKKGGYFGYYDNQITAILEGDDYEFFGWNKPVFDKISPSRALTFSWLTPNKKYDLNTNTNGEHRAFVITGTYENVFPLDIYPMQLLKACMYKDLDEMEALGIYEVAPEDFALTEFICVSKQPHQKIIRDGLDLLKQELG